MENYSFLIDLFNHKLSYLNSIIKSFAQQIRPLKIRTAVLNDGEYSIYCETIMQEIGQLFKINLIIFDDCGIEITIKLYKDLLKFCSNFVQNTSNDLSISPSFKIYQDRLAARLIIHGHQIFSYNKYIH